MPSSGNEKGTAPRQREIEVSIFGTGFGECIVAHLGLDRWIIVDSCRNPDSRKPVAIEYLAEISVEISESVHLVVATHWDDDHIGGLSEIFNLAKKAAFACPITVKKEEFKPILDAVAGTSHLPFGSGADEISKIMKERAKRRSGYAAPKLAVAQKELLEKYDGLPVRVQALSPSDAEIISAVERLRRVAPLTKDSPRLRLPRFESNDASVAISVQIGEEELVLLGADLEERGSEGVGW
jgi:hypothetical protein